MVELEAAGACVDLEKSMDSATDLALPSGANFRVLEQTLEEGAGGEVRLNPGAVGCAY